MADEWRQISYPVYVLADDMTMRVHGPEKASVYAEIPGSGLAFMVFTSEAKASELATRVGLKAKPAAVHSAQELRSYLAHHLNGGRQNVFIDFHPERKSAGLRIQDFIDAIDGKP